MTLLEVSTAIAVLVLVTAGFLQVHFWGMRATREAQQELAVSRYLNNELEAWRAAATEGFASTVAAAPRALCEEATALDGFKATVEVAPNPQGPAQLYRVAVHASWHGPGARPMHREATTLVVAMAGSR